MARPDLALVPPFYHNYINQVPQDDLMAAFKLETPPLLHFLESISADKYDHRYAEDKWTIKELLQHIMDAERIFAYRALRFARKDSTPLAAFDENLYAVTSKAGKRHWNDLVKEFRVVRAASEYLFESFDEEQLQASGVSSNKSITVIALGYIIIGHALHHKKIMEERYL